jgi:hypothetical protein
MKWFGRKGTGAAFTECEQAETPVGASCGYCREPIQAGDDGWLLPYLDIIDDHPTELAFHQACNFRQITGSVAHQQKRCSCFGGTGCDENDGMTLRQGAEAALAYWEGHGLRN